jgi:periplasmic divalent cation tolerance protein
MKTTKAFSVVLVTVPEMKVARTLARGALRAKLVACANILPGVESHYWWRGKLEQGAERLVIFKTTPSKLARLEKFVLENHPYDTPEFIALPVSAGNERYLDWISASVS